MPKKRRVPEVLWRLFRHRARTLAETIESLLPPADCRCEGRRCLRCSSVDAEDFLLRPDDPRDYRELLTRCYVVVSEVAPSRSDFSNESHWSQHQIVVRCIELITCTMRVRNVICSGYDEYTQSSPIVDLLSGPAWNLLLSRVRDGMMVYLLMHTSIFLPLSQKSHHQVAGLPINNLLSKYSAGLPNEHNLFGKPGLRKRRKRDGEQSSGSFNDPCSPFHTGYLSGKKRSYFQSSCWHQEAKQYQVGASNKISQSISTPNPTLERNSNRKSEKLSKFVTELGKRSRPFRWQRERKRRLLEPRNNCNSIPCTSVNSGKNTSLGEPPSQLSAHSCHSQKCLGSLLLQARKNIAEEVYINRKSMFYNLDSSSPIFLRGNILRSLKPNFSGSESLARHIFGSYDANRNTPSTLFCNSGTCPFGSKSLLFQSKMLKNSYIPGY